MSADDRITILVHEVRSPVAALAAIAEALRDTGAATTGRGELVRLAIGACRAIERIVSDIAVASVRTSIVDPAELVRSTVAAHVLAGTNIEARIDDGLSPIDGDPVRLRQALDNLIRNAVIHGGGRVLVSATCADEVVSLAVADSGPGIADEDLERVFEPGARLDEGRPGCGLGLAIARAIVEAHGGSLGAESSSTGATFTIMLRSAGSQPATRATRK